MMKNTITILAFLLALFSFASCHKDKEFGNEKPKISEVEVSPALNQADFTWKVEYLGKFQTGVEISSHKDLSDAKRVEATKAEDKYKATVDNLTEGTKYYYRIVVWNKYSSFEEEKSDFVTEEKKVYLVEASCQPTDGGRITGTGSYEENKYCTLNAVCNDGYDFVKWTEKGTQLSTNAKYQFKVTRNRNLVAHFAKQKFTVSLSASPSGGGTVSGGGGYDYGQNCTVSATAASGYTFSKWTENGSQVSTNANYTFTVNDNRTLVANFTKNYTINVSANPLNGGTVTGGGTYQQGQSCTVTATANTGYSFSNWTENGTQVSTNANYTFTVNGNRTLVANYNYNGGGTPPGAINGLFTINENDDQVYFSQGNLQYRASDGRWRFAEHQYDCIGESNSNISSSYSNYIDLFGWGTSGWNSGAVCYQPWSTSTSSSDYYPGGSYTNNLTGSYANADWGVYNAIYNGGNTAGQWRTLTKDEWVYVFQSRSNASSKYGHGKVNGVCGMILLPDSWTLPLGLSFTAGNSSWTNSYTTEQWAQMEANGAVFLPAAGYRNGTSVNGVGSHGFYWSASHCDFSDSTSAYYAYYVYFFNSSLNPSSRSFRYSGRSVRLVAPAE